MRGYWDQFSALLGLLGTLAGAMLVAWSTLAASKRNREQLSSQAESIAQLTGKLEKAEHASASVGGPTAAPDTGGIVVSGHQITFAYENAIANAVENLIESYHKQAMLQAGAQFWFSIGAATVGFVIIVASFVYRDGTSVMASQLKVLPGVIMEGVAFLFFKQATETRQRATELYDRLRKDRQLKDAAEEVSKIDDPAIRAITQAQIALSMAGLQPTVLDFNPVLLKAKGQ